VVHSARWDHSVDLRGRRVAVVGTGASAIQIVPAIADDVATLMVFQRSAAHLAPKPDRRYSALHRALFRHVSGARSGPWAVTSGFRLRVHTR
jgi:cation diffusion facilitator CzcD-associated flavoprotein CzcO